MYTGRRGRRSLEKLTYPGRQSWHGQTEFTKELIKFLTKIYFNKSVCAPLTVSQTHPCNRPFHICLLSSSPPPPPPLHPVMIGQKVQLCKPPLSFLPRLTTISPDLSHIYPGLFLNQLLFICSCLGGRGRLFIEFLPLAPSIRLVPLFHDKLSINSHVAILTVSKERRKWSHIWPQLDKLL